DVSLLDVSEIRTHVAGGRRVRYEHCLLVTYALRYLEGIHLTKRDADEVGVTAGVTAKGMAIPQNSGAAMAISQFGHLWLGIGVVAAGEIQTLAVFTMPAGENR